MTTTDGAGVLVGTVVSVGVILGSIVAVGTVVAVDVGVALRARIVSSASMVAATDVDCAVLDDGNEMEQAISSVQMPMRPSMRETRVIEALLIYRKPKPIINLWDIYSAVK